MSYLPNDTGFKPGSPEYNAAMSAKGRAAQQSAAVAHGNSTRGADTEKHSFMAALPGQRAPGVSANNDAATAAPTHDEQLIAALAERDRVLNEAIAAAGYAGPAA